MRLANLYALGAIALWGCLAWLGVSLGDVPPFLLVGAALSIAGCGSLPWWWRIRASWRSVALGVYGLFGFHFFLFVALRLAPAVPANLVNYLWPVLLVLLAPLVTRAQPLTVRHVMAVLIGFAGAATAVAAGTSGSQDVSHPNAALGYGCALISAAIWATYSLVRQRMAQRDGALSSASVGLYCLVSGLLALSCHAALEPAFRFSSRELPLIAILALGPMGGAFFLWDFALKRGDARTIGALAFLAPLLSTLLLVITGHGTAGTPTVIAVVLIVAGAALGSSPGRRTAA